MAATALDPSATPGATPLSIGGVTFGSGEVPETLPIGGVEHRVVVTELEGGGRVVASMGAQPTAVSWSGAFWMSPNIDAKIKALRLYAVAGGEILLTWHTESYYCKIKKFTPSYKHVNRATYEIEVEITRDANGALTNPSGQSVDEQVNALMGTATTSASQILAVDASPQALAAVGPLPTIRTGLNATGPLAQAGSNASSSLLSTVEAAVAQATAYAGTLTWANQQFVAAQQLVSSLRLIASSVKSGQSPLSIIVQGRSLFDVAAQYYGNASRAFDLMSANGLSSPQLSSLAQTTLRLPPYPKTP